MLHGSVVFLSHLTSSRHLALIAAASPQSCRRDSHTCAFVDGGVHVVVGIFSEGWSSTANQAFFVVADPYPPYICLVSSYNASFRQFSKSTNMASMMCCADAVSFCNQTPFVYRRFWSLENSRLTSSCGLGFRRFRLLFTVPAVACNAVSGTTPWRAVSSTMSSKELDTKNRQRESIRSLCKYVLFRLRTVCACPVIRPGATKGNALHFLPG